jgi:uncharacterized protein
MRFMQATNRAIRLAAVAIALAVSSPAVHAQQPSAAALLTAKELMNVTGSALLFSSHIDGVVEQVKFLYLQQDPSLSKDLNEIANKLRTDLTPRLEELSNEMARRYTAHFTEQELKDLLAFYKTPLGKKMLTEQPQVVNESLQFAEGWKSKLADEVIGKMRDELKKKGHKL